MPDIVNACDAGLAVLQNNPTFRTVYPNKVFDYMSCARPVVLAIDGVARTLVCDQAEAGIFAEPENAVGARRRLCAFWRIIPRIATEWAATAGNWVLANASRDSSGVALPGGDREPGQGGRKPAVSVGESTGS